MLEEQQPDHMQPLHHAAMHCRLEIIKLLIEEYKVPADVPTMVRKITLTALFCCL